MSELFLTILITLTSATAILQFILILEDVIKERESKNKVIFVKYFSDNVSKLEKIEKGDWIDLSNSCEINLKAGESALIPLGVGMKLPYGCEANIVPRSSTFKKYGIIQTNHYAVIDNSYSGDKDEWKYPVYATRDIIIPINTRICQFRINENQPNINFIETPFLDDKNRNGFGSTD